MVAAMLQTNEWYHNQSLVMKLITLQKSSFANFYPLHIAFSSVFIVYSSIQHGIKFGYVAMAAADMSVSEDSNIDVENGYIMGDLDGEVGGHSWRKQLGGHRQFPLITLLVVTLLYFA